MSPVVEFGGGQVSGWVFAATGAVFAVVCVLVWQSVRRKVQRERVGGPPHPATEVDARWLAFFAAANSIMMSGLVSSTSFAELPSEPGIAAAGVVGVLGYAGYGAAVGTYLLTRRPEPGWRGPRIAGGAAVLLVAMGLLGISGVEDSVGLPALAVAVVTVIIVHRTVRRPSRWSAFRAGTVSTLGGIMLVFTILGTSSDGRRPMSPLLPPLAHVHLGFGLFSGLAAGAVLVLLLGLRPGARAARTRRELVVGTEHLLTTPTPLGPEDVAGRAGDGPEAGPIHPSLLASFLRFSSSTSAGFTLWSDDDTTFSVGDMEVLDRVTVLGPGLWEVDRSDRGQWRRVFRTNDRHAVDAYLIDTYLSLELRRQLRDVVETARIESSPTGHVVHWAQDSWAETDGPAPVGVGRWRAEQLADLVNADLGTLLAPRYRRPFPPAHRTDS